MTMTADSAQKNPTTSAEYGPPRNRICYAQIQITNRPRQPNATRKKLAPSPPKLGGDYGSGWPLINRGNSFVDTTARAVLALAYFKDDPEVKDSLRRAKDWLLENQNEDGGWGIWKYEDSLVSATSFTLLAFRCLVDIFPEDENIKLSILRAAAWLKNAQDPKSGLWGFTPITKESQVEPNNASTRMAVYTLYKLGEDLAEYLPALGSFIEEFKKEGRWQTISETYTLKYFGEGLDPAAKLV
jgi:hypothetical protein